jgi:hypothetical protein
VQAIRLDFMVSHRALRASNVLRAPGERRTEVLFSSVGIFLRAASSRVPQSLLIVRPTHAGLTIHSNH